MADKTPEEIAAEAKAAADKAATDKAAADKGAAKKVAVRLLVDTVDHSCNDVIELSSADAAVAVAEGWADDHPSAVAYARKLAKAAAPADAE